MIISGINIFVLWWGGRGLQEVFKSECTLHSMLTKVKDTLPYYYHQVLHRLSQSTLFAQCKLTYVVLECSEVLKLTAFSFM